MKLRNKKTGEIGRLYFDHQLIDPKTGTYAIVIQHRDKLGYEAFANYFTLAELNAEWEDYKPAEPLIKDEKIRKAVRAWAKHWGIKELRAYIVAQGILTLSSWPASSVEYEKDIDIQAAFVTGDVEGGGLYTIDELCGEEEE